MSPETAHQVRIAIALLTQVRQVLYADAVIEELDKLPCNAALVPPEAGSLRLRLTLALRREGLEEQLKDESIEGIVKAIGARGR